MTTLEMTVKGTKRNVHLETPFSNGKARARLNVGKNTVSGYVKVNSAGTYRFTAIGKNAGLI